MNKLSAKARKFVAATAIALVSVTGLAACGGGVTQSANQKEQNQEQSQLNQLEQANPIPSYNSSQLRQNLIDIENIQANSTQTTSFFMQMGNQDPVFVCPSIGLPIPVTDQLTNPEQVLNDGYPNGGAVLTVPQIDPTGVYSGQSSGTNVVCTDANGKPYIMYWEGDVLSATYGATWDRTTHSVQLIGGPTAQVHAGGK